MKLAKDTPDYIKAEFLLQGKNCGNCAYNCEDKSFKVCFNWANGIIDLDAGNQRVSVEDKNHMPPNPNIGDFVIVEDEQKYYSYNGSGWLAAAGLSASRRVSGKNTRSYKSGNASSGKEL